MDISSITRYLPSFLNINREAKKAEIDREKRINEEETVKEVIATERSIVENKRKATKSFTPSKPVISEKKEMPLALRIILTSNFGEELTRSSYELDLNDFSTICKLYEKEAREESKRVKEILEKAEDVNTWSFYSNLASTALIGTSLATAGVAVYSGLGATLLIAGLVEATNEGMAAAGLWKKLASKISKDQDSSQTMATVFYVGPKIFAAVLGLSGIGVSSQIYSGSHWANTINQVVGRSEDVTSMITNYKTSSAEMDLSQLNADHAFANTNTQGLKTEMHQSASKVKAQIGIQNHSYAAARSALETEQEAIRIAASVA